LKLQFKNAPLFSLPFHVPPFCGEGRFNRHWFNGADKLLANRLVDAEAAEHHTPALAKHNVPAVASVHGLVSAVRRMRGVVDSHPAAAAAANEHPDEESSAAASRLNAVAAAIRIG